MSVDIKQPAKRGDVAMIETYSSWTYTHGKTVRNTSYILGIVTSVSREGRVKAVDVGNGSIVRDPVCNVGSQADLDMPALREALAKLERFHAFPTAEDAVAFVKPFKRS